MKKCHESKKLPKWNELPKSPNAPKIQRRLYVYLKRNNVAHPVFFSQTVGNL